jgi:hypothetical protein
MSLDHIARAMPGAAYHRHASANGLSGRQATPDCLNTSPISCAGSTRLANTGRSLAGGSCRRHATLDAISAGNAAAGVLADSVALSSGGKGRHASSVGMTSATITTPISLMATALPSSTLVTLAAAARSEAAAWPHAQVDTSMHAAELAIQLPGSRWAPPQHGAVAKGASSIEEDAMPPASSSAAGACARRPAPLLLTQGSTRDNDEPPGGEEQQQQSVLPFAQSPAALQQTSSEGGLTQTVQPKAAPQDHHDMLLSPRALSPLDSLRARRQARAVAHARGEPLPPSPTCGASFRQGLAAPWHQRTSHDSDAPASSGSSQENSSVATALPSPLPERTGLRPGNRAESSGGSQQAPGSVPPAGTPCRSAVGQGSQPTTSLTGGGSSGGFTAGLRRAGGTAVGPVSLLVDAPSLASSSHGSSYGSAAAAAKLMAGRTGTRVTVSGSGSVCGGGGTTAGAVVGPAVAAQCFKITPSPGNGGSSSTSGSVVDTITYIKYTNLGPVAERDRSHDTEVGAAGWYAVLIVLASGGPHECPLKVALPPMFSRGLYGKIPKLDPPPSAPYIHRMSPTCALAP